MGTMEEVPQSAVTTVPWSCKTVATILPQVEVQVPDEMDQRFSVLTYEQVKKLSNLMSEVVPIHGRGNFPTIEVRLCDLVSVVKAKLESDGVMVKEIRLNGSGASSVLAEDYAGITYNDLDLIFSVDLTTDKAYEKVKSAVLEALMHLLPEGVSRKRMSTCSLKEAYVSKMVKVNDSDRWSLFTLGNNNGGKTVELKFVNNMRRQYEFSVDSFHIMLDTLFLFYECSGSMPVHKNFYPTVVGESMYGDFNKALFHLHKKLIATRNPEEIRGGGLLKYCNLLCQNYRPAAKESQVKNMERYMCSRYFIDFPDINQQRAKLENYLYNHFQSSEDRMKYDYLMILYQVVNESTVCLMGHERRLTLSLIEDMALQVYSSDYYAISEPGQESVVVTKENSCGGSGVLSDGPKENIGPEPSNFSLCCSVISTDAVTSAAPFESCSSSASTCSSMSTGLSSSSPSLSFPSPNSSAPSSGTATPQKPPTPAPPLQIHAYSTPPPTLPHNAVVAASNHLASSQQQPPLIPTYEIVTSCQPAVIYSNGYYYTSFLQPATSTAIAPPPQAQLQPSCPSCSCANNSNNNNFQWTVTDHRSQNTPVAIQGQICS